MNKEKLKKDLKNYGDSMASGVSPKYLFERHSKEHQRMRIIYLKTGVWHELIDYETFLAKMPINYGILTNLFTLWIEKEIRYLRKDLIMLKELEESLKIN